MHCRFLPSSCPEHCAVVLDEDGAIRDNGSKREVARRLDLSAWLLAWDGYAMACEVTKQLPFKAAMQHKALVVQVAADAVAEQKRPILGVLFDEVSRYSVAVAWENLVLAVVCPSVAGGIGLSSQEKWAIGSASNMPLEPMRAAAMSFC